MVQLRKAELLTPEEGILRRQMFAAGIFAAEV